MSSNNHRNSARNQLRETTDAKGNPKTISAVWFERRRSRNRVRDRISKLARRKNRGK